MSIAVKVRIASAGERAAPALRHSSAAAVTAHSKYFFAALRYGPTPSEYLLNCPISCLF